MPTIDNLSIEVTASADRASRVFDRLASNADRVRGAARGAAGGMQDMAQGARDAGTETQRAGTQAGQAQSRFRGAGNAAKDAGDKAKKGASGIKVFWESLKRIALYRFVRSIIREITDAFKTGITNLYHWSDAINGHFASAMDRLATSSQYLKNSLGAMVAPLIESFIPVLDVIIDKIVDVLNFFNMLVAAVSGADTYTVAKKSAAVWDDAASKTSSSAKKAADDIKRTLLGFDEINKLVSQNNSSGSGGSGSGKKTPNYSAMFEEKPLTGIFKKISDITSGWPDWLKALLGVGTAGLAIFGIPALLRTIWNWLKKLFALDVPNWLRWLFSPKGDGNDSGIDRLKDLTLPDTDLTINPVKGDWSVLNDLTDGITVPVGLKHWGWDNIKDWIGAAVTISIGLHRWGWDSVPEWLGIKDGVYVRVGLLHWGWDNIEDWIGTAVTVNVALRKWGWDSIRKWLGLDNAINANINLRKWGWDSIRKWLGLEDAITANINLRKWGWDSIKTWMGLDDPVIADIGLNRWNWTTLGEWTGADNGLYVNIGLLRWGWTTIEDFIGTAITVSVGLAKWGWDTIAGFIGEDNHTINVNLWPVWEGQSPLEYLGLKGLSTTVAVHVMTGWWYNNVSVLEYLGLKNLSTTVTIYTQYAGGGSSSSNRSGGGSTSGGGAGRSRHANGGIYSNGAWYDIPQYANGVADVGHGTLFWAGERGAEIVGNAGGRTEVLNRSQIASAIYSAVQAAMAPASANFAQAAAYMSNRTDDSTVEMMAEMVRVGVEQAMERERDILRQQLETLRQINDKDFSANISTSDINKAQTRANRRAGTTIVPVG